MKFRSPGNDEAISKLGEMGAKRVSDVVMEDLYFSHPGRDFGCTDESLRLRTSEDGCDLTYKGPRMATSPAKAREELTVSIADELSTRRILERLGFREFASVKKRRTSFLFDKLRIDVDEVEGLGEFIELELLTEDPSRADALISEVREEMSLTEPIAKTYLELLSEKAGRPGSAQSVTAQMNLR